MEHDVASVAPATQLLDEYAAGSSFFLSSPHRTLLAQGTFDTLQDQSESDKLNTLPERVAALLHKAGQQKKDHPIVVGAIPFDHTMPAQLFIPDHVRWAGPLPSDSMVNAQRSVLSTYDIQSVPEPSDYVRGVEQGLAGIAAGNFHKIVLARSLHLTSPTTIDIHQLLRNLARHNTKGYTFAVDLPPQQPDTGGMNNDSSLSRQRTLIGASPELLVARTGRCVTANPLAGSTPRSDDPVEDQRRAAALLSSAKDLHEHAVVVDAVADSLRPFCRTLEVPPKPSLVQTATMWHLSSEIIGELEDPQVSSLALAVALHPTPAVCGAPTDKARAAIREIEPFDRGFYTGIVGWCDAAGDGEWIVTIRCAEADEHSLRLYAGAGVVAESRPEAELAETSAKFRTMLLAMGLNQESLK